MSELNFFNDESLENKENIDCFYSKPAESPSKIYGVSRQSLLKKLDPFYTNKSEENNDTNLNNSNGQIYNLSEETFRQNDSVVLINFDGTENQSPKKRKESSPFRNESQYEKVQILDVTQYLKDETTSKDCIDLDDLLSLKNKVVSIETVENIRKCHQKIIKQYIVNECKLNDEVIRLNDENSRLKAQIENDKVITEDKASKMQKEHENNLKTELESCSQMIAEKLEEIDILKAEINQLSQQLKRSSSELIYKDLIIDQYYDTSEEIAEQCKSYKIDVETLLKSLNAATSKYSKTVNMVNFLKNEVDANEEKIKTLEHEKCLLDNELKDERTSIFDFYDRNEKDINILNNQFVMLKQADAKIADELNVRARLMEEIQNGLVNIKPSTLLK